MSKPFAIADNLRLPIEAITSTCAILAIRGVGKSHAASVMSEEFLKIGQPIVAYDPTGAWWGLKASADGKRPGFPVVVFGGEHADVPLEETAGEVIAGTIVEKRIPAILDCSLLRKAARIRFMTAFCETLYHKNREPLHLFLDEAHTVAPQNIWAMPEASRVLGAVEDIILQGRKRGIGLTAISPRPQMLNTSVRSACQTLVAMRTVGKHDRQAIEEWIEAHGDPQRAKELLASLASLPRGDAWVWNPAEDLFQRIHFRARETFDSSATPAVGKRVAQPKQLAEVDIEALGSAIKATIERAEADDPKKLRERIAAGEKQIAAGNKRIIDLEGELREAKTAASEVKVIQAVPEGVLSTLKRISGEAFSFQVASKTLADNHATLTTSLVDMIAEIETIRGAWAKMDAETRRRGEGVKATPRVPPSPSLRVADQRPRFAESGPRAVADITPRAQKFLDAAATLETLQAELTRVTVAAWCGVHPRGGSVGEVLKELADAQLITIDRGQITVTGTGRSAAATLDPTKAIERARSGLSTRQANFFALIYEAYPRPVTREAIAQRFEIHPRGGSLGDDLRALKNRGLVDYDKRGYRARDFLFAGSQS